MIRNALVIGATGMVGKELISILVRSDYYNSLHIVTRRPYELEHRKIKSYTINFDNFDHLTLHAHIQDVYVCLGTTMKKAGSKENFRKVDLEYVVSVARWAKKSHAEKFAVISSMGASAQSGNFYLQTKGQMENALIGMKLPKLIILRPSLLMGKREEFRLAERTGTILAKPLMKVMRGKLKKYVPVYAVQVAKTMFFSTLNSIGPVQVIENIDIARLSK